MTVDQLASGGQGQLGIAATGSGLWLGGSVDMLARGLVLACWTGGSVDMLARGPVACGLVCPWTGWNERVIRGRSVHGAGALGSGLGLTATTTAVWGVAELHWAPPWL